MSDYVLRKNSFCAIDDVYACKGDYIALGSAILDGEASSDALVKVPLKTMNSSSELVRKYSQAIDRESAYEILSRKVADIEKEAADEAASKEWEKSASAKDSADNSRRGDWGKQHTRPSSRTTYGRSRTPQDQMVKVLTSAIFIRGYLGF